MSFKIKCNLEQTYQAIVLIMLECPWSLIHSGTSIEKMNLGGTIFNAMGITKNYQSFAHYYDDDLISIIYSFRQG